MTQVFEDEIEGGFSDSEVIQPDLDSLKGLPPDLQPDLFVRKKEV